MTSKKTTEQVRISHSVGEKLDILSQAIGISKSKIATLIIEEGIEKIYNNGGNVSIKKVDDKYTAVLEYNT